MWSASMTCYYCDMIAAVDPTYAPREAAFDTGSEAPRCPWHWRMVCDHCGESGHYMTRFYCPRSDRLLCRAAGAVAPAYGDFWGRMYWWTLSCPDCGNAHPSLDHAEYDGSHPWQRNTAAVGQRWLSDETELARYPPHRLPPVDQGILTDGDSDRNWSANADAWESGYDERGDDNRKYSSDPILFDFLGPVADKRILDAGSGTGYLARLLARQGARVVAVENAVRFHEIALAYQQRDPLDIAHYHGSISAMPFLESNGFDAVVANYVLIDVRDYESAIDEIARVLKPGGHFVYTLTHGSTDAHWHAPAPDSPRQEDRAGWIDDGYFVRRAGYSQWGGLRPVLGFHRPLRDYIAACKRAGLELRDLEEPWLSAEAEHALPPPSVCESLRIPVSYVVKAIKGT